MELERAKEKMVHCHKFVEDEAIKLLSELKAENETYGEIRQILERIPMDNYFGFVVKRAKELLEREISTIKLWWLCYYRLQINNFDYWSYFINWSGFNVFKKLNVS